MSIYDDNLLYCSGSKEDLSPDLHTKTRINYSITALGEITKSLGVKYQWDKDQNSPYYIIISGMQVNTNELIPYYTKIRGHLAK